MPSCTDYLCFFLVITLLGCSQNPKRDLSNWEEIAGRDDPFVNGSVTRHPLYRAYVPRSWARIDPDLETSIYDTMKPLCEFRITEDKKEIKIAVHNFPSEKLEDRIPPFAQVERWKRQLHSPRSESIFVVPQGHGGFCGLFFQGDGFLENKPTRVYAWVMQLDPELYQNLILRGTPEETSFYKQMRSDYTIKATGSPELFEKYQEEINRFARSFELIQEIPHE